MIFNFAAQKNMLALNVLLSVTGLNINGSVNSAFMSTVQLILQLQQPFSKETHICRAEYAAATTLTTCQ